MRTLLICLLLSSSALAKAWNGIDPGVSTKEDVIAKFGEPSKVITSPTKEQLVYYQAKAIKGSKQAQFQVDPATKKVMRIDVFPAGVVDKEAIEGSYGGPCPKDAPPVGFCYVKKLTSDLRVYYLYSNLGLAVFFDKEEKSVESITFKPAKG